MKKKCWHFQVVPPQWNSLVFYSSGVDQFRQLGDALRSDANQVLLQAPEMQHVCVGKTLRTTSCSMKNYQNSWKTWNKTDWTWLKHDSMVNYSVSKICGKWWVVECIESCLAIFKIGYGPRCGGENLPSTCGSGFPLDTYDMYTHIYTHVHMYIACTHIMHIFIMYIYIYIYNRYIL